MTAGLCRFHSIDYYTTVLPDLLHYAKTKLWEQSKCKKAYGSKVKDSMFCAGYDYGGIDSCKVRRIVAVVW